MQDAKVTVEQKKLLTETSYPNIFIVSRYLDKYSERMGTT